MTIQHNTLKPIAKPKRPLLIAGVVLTFLIAVTVTASVLSGYGLNVRSFGKAVLHAIRATSDHAAVIASSGDYRNVVFLHHSVGRGLLDQSDMRKLFTEAGYRLWDHDYNYAGLTDPMGKALGYSYNVPADNTDPDGLLNIFTQPVYDLPLNTLSGLMQHDVIVLKSCFPASNITSDDQLAERRSWYLKMRDFMDQHPEKIFVLVTPPPLNPAETSPAAAQRARDMADWLMSAEFSSGHPNLFVYDLFARLAEDEATRSDFNMLREDYREDIDSHPTRNANQQIGPDLTRFVIQSIDQYRLDH